MAKQTNTPEDWKILADQDLSVADHHFALCSTITHFSVQPRYDRGTSLSKEDLAVILAHTKTIKDFLQKEIPELFRQQSSSRQAVG